jgi:hypothetical protein
MRRVLSPAACAGCAVLLAVAGCASEVHFQETKDISIANAFDHVVGAPTSAQKVRIEVTAAKEPVDVWVMLEKDYNENTDKVDQDMSARKPPPNILKYVLNTQETTLEVDIPAKQECHVWVTVLKKPTPVTVKINSL